MRASQVFIASFDHLNEMLNFVRSYCMGFAFNSSELNKINIATEEALVNIICHGYPFESNNNVEISCTECLDKPGVQILIKDWGPPFNPLEDIDKIKEKHHQYIRENVIGGYGIFLYIKIMDGVEYNREEEANTLCFIKYIDGKEG